MTVPEVDSPGGRTPAVSVPELRIGHGFDVHRFSDDPDRRLVLGGVEFAGERGLVGHSDADAVAHAAADALLGAAGLGDIGQQFPDTDPAYAGADSMMLLAHVVELVSAAGWRIANVDCSVVCERPKLAPRRDEMGARLAAVVGAPVTVSGRRAEGLGAIGRVEGVACFAVGLLHRAVSDSAGAEPAGTSPTRPPPERSPDEEPS